MNKVTARKLFDKRRLHAPFMWLVTGAGAAACLFSAYRLNVAAIDLEFMLLAFVTVTFGSRIGVQIPKVKAEITVSDTFVFLIMLLYGGEAAVLVAAADALCSSMRFAERWRTRFFNAAQLAISTLIAAWAILICVDSIKDVDTIIALGRPGNSHNLIIALFIMASVQYLANSGLAAARESLKRDQPFKIVWQKHFLWTSISYYAGASAAGIIVTLITHVGFYAFFVALPIIGIMYFTYRTYRKNIVEAEQHAIDQENISQKLMQSEQHFRNAFDHAAGMALISPLGHWLQVNSSLCQMLGYTEEQLLKMNFQEMTHPEELAEDLVHIYSVLEGKVKSDQREKRYLNKSGKEIWVLQSASLVANSQGEPLHMILQIQDITERKLAEAQVQRAAFHDALTGLPNRTLLSDRLSLALARAKRISSHQFAVLFLDLDRFKLVNDSLGHTLGDQLLVEVSRRVERCMRKMDTLARFGGDEFAMLVDSIAGPQDAIHIAERVLEAISKPFDLNGHEHFVSASIGIAFSQSGYQAPENILRDADTAMYRAKANGKARYEIFDAKMHAAAVEMMTLERELRRAVDRGEIEVYYQPVISLDNNRLESFEALARWRHPTRGLILPAQFIPIAEETGLIVPVGMQVLRAACRQLREWQTRNSEGNRLCVSVNLSSRQFAQTDLVEQIQHILEETSLKPGCLCLEVTESVIMEKAETATEMLLRLKDLGVRLSIDDFGTGYSSLSYLHRFPFDILKIDQSFVSRMCRDKDSKGIVETIVTLARNLNKQVVAEGVETAEQLAVLKSLGCDLGQGYLLSAPMPVEDVDRFISRSFDWVRDGGSLIDSVPQSEVDADAFSM